jgi:predicted nuclease of predicted toxin-antitoxin system
MLKFLLDAQLPRRLQILFANFGYEALHTLDLPEGNRTKDRELERICEEENRILVIKDNDFVESFLIRRRPERLLFLSCGNLSNSDLENLFRLNLARIADEFSSNRFIEVTREDIIIHS